MAARRSRINLSEPRRRDRSPNQRAEPPDSFASLGMGQSMALIVGCTWVLIALVLIFRLFAGRLVLARLRQEAVDIGGTTNSLLNDCRRALSLSRPVVVAVHPSGWLARDARRPRPWSWFPGFGRVDRLKPPRLPAARARAPGPPGRLHQDGSESFAVHSFSILWCTGC